MKCNTLPLNQANFDVLMMAFHTLAARLQTIEDKPSVCKCRLTHKDSVSPLFSIAQVGEL